MHRLPTSRSDLTCTSGSLTRQLNDLPIPRCRAINLGIFQGISIGGAFVFAFPISGVLGQRLGPRKVLLIASAIQLLNFLLIVFVTPESSPAPLRAGRRLDLRSANPLGALRKLFGSTRVLRLASCSYFFISIARNVSHK